jgi:hypothetical protein
VTVQGMKLLNPSSVGLPTGTRQIAIFVDANEVGVLGNFIEGWQNGVVVNDQGPTGTAVKERRNIRIHFNRVKDVVGVGGGPSSDSEYGEDRADGIVSWGAQVSIVGNVVNAKPGTDARIGIHVEQLYGTEIEPTAHDSALATISGNVVTGTFRRGIVDEMVKCSTITGNVVADATWWGITLARVEDGVVADNTVLWTRTAADNQGSHWSPDRAAIMVYGSCVGARIVNNTCLVAATADLPSFIQLHNVVENVGDSPADTVVTGNTVHVDAGGKIDIGIDVQGKTTNTLVESNHLDGPMRIGIHVIEGDQDVQISNNVVEGGITDSGVFVYKSSRVLLSGNTIKVSGKRAIYCEYGGSPESVICTGNTLVNTGAAAGVTALSIINAGTAGCVVASNHIDNFDVGCQFFGTTATVSDMVYTAVGTRSQFGTLAEGSYVHNGIASLGPNFALNGHTHTAADVIGALSWTTTVPGTPADPGTRGQFTADGQFMYVHTGAGWKRLAFDIWS